MRLTFALMKRKMPPGFIWTGKHRLGHNVYPLNIEGKVKSLQIEERNMFLLRNPFLTVEQESGHASQLNKHQKWLDTKKIETAAKRVTKSTRIEDKLGYLYLSTKWEL